MTKYILGIETSCDDTSIALLTDSQNPKLILHKSYDQDSIMAKWGGVVPEIAARNHSEKLILLFKNLLEQKEIALTDISAIGVTTHPGLLGPLLTGINIAKTLSLIYKIPLISVNHLWAHLEAIHLSEDVSYPYLGVLVSGGHSSFYKVHSHEHFEHLGGTIDDAAGEAFDKGGKLLGLPYPSGRIIDQISQKGNKDRFPFPIGLRFDKSCNLSYSGLKTSLRVFLDKNPHITHEHADFPDVIASYQEAIVWALKIKLEYAMNDENLPIVVGGGVACNSRLRRVLNESYPHVHFASPEFCTDNAAMVANYALRNKQLSRAYPDSLDIDARSVATRGVKA